MSRHDFWMSLVLTVQRQEATTKVIDIKEIDFATLSYCIEFLYTDSYNHTTGSAAGLEPIEHARVYSASTMFFIPWLPEIARQAFAASLERKCSGSFDTMLATLDQLENDTFPLADRLRKEVAKYLCAGTRTWRMQDSFWKAMSENPHLCLDLLKATLIPAKRFCNSRSCKMEQSLHTILACDTCGISTNVPQDPVPPSVSGQ